MKPPSFSKAAKKLLLELARGAIAERLGLGPEIEIDRDNASAKLRANSASFVTLKIDDCLRGCVGSLEAISPLVVCVPANAVGAAFRDSRFPPLEAPELEKLSISISVLSRMEKVNYKDEKDLMYKLRPGVDGLVIEQGARTATFLPAVWKTLPAPADFLESLKAKGGIEGALDSKTGIVSRYTSVAWSEANL